MPELTFTLAPRPPFRLDLTVWALRRRAHNVVDRFEDGVWRRVLVVDDLPVVIRVAQTRFGPRPEVEVRVSGPRVRSVKQEVATTVTRMLGLDLDLSGFYRIAQSNERLEALADRLRGMKPVLYATVFETFANAVACQLVSLSAGMHVLNRLADAFGVSADLGRSATPMRSFPAAAAIAHSTPDAMRALGLSRQKGEYLIGLARLAMDPTDPDFASIAALANDDALVRLLKIRGVGRWTAEYVMLRGFGRIDIFPGDDVGGRNKLFEWFGTEDAHTYEGVSKMLRRWHPYAGLIYLHLIVNAATGGANFAQSAAV